MRAHGKIHIPYLACADQDSHLKKFLPLIRDSPVYPVLYDALGRVMSLPPIINSDHSKITLNTRNVFIEVTATDRTKANVVLNTVVCMFAQYCLPAFAVEAVTVTEEPASGGGGDAVTRVTPDLRNREMQASPEYINRCIGIDLKPAVMVSILDRMSLSVVSASAHQLVVSIPPTRSDVLHPCDIMEDVAIAYGYDKIVRTVPAVQTTASQQPLNALTDGVRNELAQAGYTEVLTFSLVSHDENFANMRRVDNGRTAVCLANPATIEYQVGRTSLLPGMFKTTRNNKSQPKPIRIFEVSDVMLLDDKAETKARNERRVAAIYTGSGASGFEQVREVMRVRVRSALARAHTLTHIHTRALAFV